MHGADTSRDISTELLEECRATTSTSHAAWADFNKLNHLFTWESDVLLILNCHFIVLTAHFSPPCCSWIWVPGWPGLPVLITAVSLQLALM